MRVFLLVVLSCFIVCLCRAQDQVDTSGFDTYTLAEDLVNQYVNLGRRENEAKSISAKEKEDYRDRKRRILTEAYRYYGIILTDYSTSIWVKGALLDRLWIDTKLGRNEAAKANFELLYRANESWKPTKMEPLNGTMNNALRFLTAIQISERDYEGALRLLDSLKFYKRGYMCGFQAEEDQRQIDKLYGNCYIETGRVKKGLSLLVPQILDDYEQPVDSSHVDYTFSILVKLHGKEELRKKFVEASEHIKTERKKSLKVYYIDFLGSKIELDRTSEAEFDASYLKEMYKDSKFYRLLYQ